jgi:hypothetical protein
MRCSATHRVWNSATAGMRRAAAACRTAPAWSRVGGSRQNDAQENNGTEVEL